MTERRGQMKTVMVAFLIGAASLVSSGCGAYMAFTQPPAVDIAALQEPNMPRTYYLERLGVPKGTTTNADGTRVDVYEFYEGSSQGWSKGRGAFHVAADVLTLCLWEIVATPMEWGLRGDKLTARAEFDKNEQATSFKIVGREEKPLEKIHRPQSGA
jgi:hypothetical protein